MAPRLKLIASDLDGTVVRRDGTISARTARALADAAAAGIRVILVTGRPVRWLDSIYEQLGAAYVAVCANGAAVYDPETKAVTFEHTLTAAQVERACAAIRVALPGVTFAAEAQGGMLLMCEADYPRRDPHAVDLDIATVAEMAASRPVKLLARLDGWDGDSLTAAVADAAGATVTATHSTASGLVEMSAPGVDKATGLGAYADSQGLRAADAVVFGDMPNDLPLFTWARSGGGQAIAVANAHPLVRSAATATTAANDDDGVAVYLESLLRSAAR